jgi:hypothetical protein
VEACHGRKQSEALSMVPARLVRSYRYSLLLVLRIL